MNTIIFSLFNHPIAANLAKSKNIELGKCKLHTFPDKETCLQLLSDVENKEIILIDSLEFPNEKILALLFFCETAKEFGAKKIHLIAPYLCYMRQDTRFKPKEAITSKTFAGLISNYFDSITTVDPHLHRYHSLSEIYSIPNKVLHAAKLMADWLKTRNKKFILIGPDKESKQWVAQIAAEISAPYVILNKIRKSDTKVEVTLPDIQEYHDHTPVLMDDIISSGFTMIEALKQVKKVNSKPAVVLVVHGLFIGDAYQRISDLGVNTIATCNTIKHSSNVIDVTQIINK